MRLILHCKLFRRNGHCGSQVPGTKALMLYSISAIYLAVPTVLYGDFEWDESKAASNLDKHGVSFEEAAEALASDPYEVAVEDPTDPTRAISLVMSSRHPRVLFVILIELVERTRIISARKATPHEERIYAKDRP
jgi:uncharacterized DUF497 family protein